MLLFSNAFFSGSAGAALLGRGALLLLCCPSVTLEGSGGATTPAAAELSALPFETFACVCASPELPNSGAAAEADSRRSQGGAARPGQGERFGSRATEEPGQEDGQGAAEGCGADQG